MINRQTDHEPDDDDEAADGEEGVNEMTPLAHLAHFGWEAVPSAVMRRVVMLLLVLKATESPKLVGKADLEQLRALGWNDGEIMDAVYHGARNVAADIVFNAFKIENDA